MNNCKYLRQARIRIDRQRPNIPGWSKSNSYNNHQESSFSGKWSIQGFDIYLPVNTIKFICFPEIQCFKNWDWPFIVRCNGYIIGLLHFIVLQIDPESEEFQFLILIIFGSKLIYYISLWYFLVEVILKFWHNHSTKLTRTRHIFSARTQIEVDPCQRVTLGNIHNSC